MSEFRDERSREQEVASRRAREDQDEINALREQCAHLESEGSGYGSRVN